MRYVIVVSVVFLCTLIFAQMSVRMDQALVDLDFLFEKMVNVHPNIFFFLSQEQAQEEFIKVRTQIQSKESWNATDLFKVLSRFVAKFKDGHTYLSITDLFSEYINSGGKVIPLFVVFTDSDIRILESIDEELPPSSKLVSINDMSAEQLREEILSMVSFERESFAYARAQSLFHLFCWVIFGSRDRFTVRVLNDCGEIEEHEIDAVDFMKYREKRNQLNMGIEKLWDLSLVDQQTAIMTINTFGSEYEKQMRQFLKDSFEQIQKQGITNLIIDIRKNGGGTTNIAEYLYSFLSDKPYRVFAQVHVKYSDEALKELKIFDPILLFRVKVLNQKIIINRSSFKKPPKNPLRFNGNIYILTGPLTFSAATDFAAMIKDLSVGKVVGQETGGLASCYGDVLSFTLPNSRLQLGVSFKYFVRCGDFDDGKGVIPDIVVEVDPFSQEIDQVVQAALNDIYGK